MADTSVIKSFLVKLGYVQDEAALKKFSDGIERATRSVFLLATAVTASATAVAIGVERFASNLNQLYFAAQRTGTSATHIRAFQRTIMDFGGSAEDALSSMEGLATFLRNSPHGQGQAWINQWLAGVGKSMTGDLSKDMISIGQMFAKNTREGNAYLNSGFASAWGISQQTALQIQMPGFGQAQQDIFERLKAAGFDKASDDAKNFIRQLHEMGDWLTIIGTKVLEVFQVKFGRSMGQLNAYLEKNGDAIANRIVRGVILLVHFLEQLEPLIKRLITWFTWLENHTGGWATTLITIIALLNLFGGFAMIERLYKWQKEIRAVVRGWGEVRAAAKAAELATTAAAEASIAGHFKQAEMAGHEVLVQEQRAMDAVMLGESAAAMTAAGVAAKEAAAARAAGLAERAALDAGASLGVIGGLKLGAKFLFGKVVPVVGAAWTGYDTVNMLHDAYPDSPVWKPGEMLGGALANLTEPKRDATKVYSGNTPMQILMRLGWSAEAAAGMIGSLQVESGDSLDPNAYGSGKEARGMPGEAYGIAQWHPDRQRRFRQWTKDVLRNEHDIHGTSRDEQLAFLDYESRHQEKAAGDRIRASISQAEAGHYSTTLFERADPNMSQEKLRIAKGEKMLASVQNTTHINIAGNADAGTVRQIEAAQDKLLAKTVRDLKLAVF